MASNRFIYNENYFKQINGTPMGSPLSVIIAEIVMQYIETQTFNSAGYLIKFGVFYVNYVFVNEVATIFRHSFH